MSIRTDIVAPSGRVKALVLRKDRLGGSNLNGMEQERFMHFAFFTHVDSMKHEDRHIVSNLRLMNNRPFEIEESQDQRH